MAETAIAYSESGVGKTTLCCSLARMIYEEYGLTTRLVTVEGWGPIENEGLVEAGIVQPFNVLSRPSNKILSTMRKLSRGWWPKIVEEDVPVMVNGVETGEIRRMKVRKIVEDKAALEKVGLYFIETLDNICGKFMSILIQEEVIDIDSHTGKIKVRSIGPQGSSGRYEEDGEVFGGNSEGHYNISQVEGYNLVNAYSSLGGGVKLVFFTSHVGTGKIKKPMYGMQSGEACYTPALVGEAKNHLVPSWVGDCFHLDCTPEVFDNNGNKIQDKIVRAFYVNHRDVGLMEGPQYLCKSRVGPSALDLLGERFPGGFIQLGTKEGEGIDQYYRWLKGMKGSNVKSVLKWKEEIDGKRTK